MALPLVENEEEAGKYVPIFSRALEGSFIATSHLSAAFRKNIRTMVLLSCGNYQSELDSRTSVLITKRNDGAKYFAAARASIPSVTPQWIRDVFRTSTFLNPGNYIVPPFSKLVFCATGFTRDERQKLQLKIGLSGGSWSPELKRSVTHLIVDLENQDNNSKKLKYALQWGVKLVSHAWVRACIENGFYCPTDDSTKSLYPALQSKTSSATHTNDPSPNTSDGDEKGAPLPAVSTFARYAGLTPAPAPVSRDTSTVTSEESDPNTTNHSSWMNGSNIGNTPFRKVSVRQSHLDLRSTINARRKVAHQPVIAEYDELEGDRPDDVDTDSEDEAGVVLASSQQPSRSADAAPQNGRPQADQQLSRNNKVPNPPTEPPKRTTNTNIDSASLYEDLDRQTQEQLVSHALDVYFKGPMMDEHEAHEAQHNDQHLLEGSKSFHFFDGVTISIIGVPRKEELANLDDRRKKQLEELESAEEEFIERGGALVLPSNSTRILVFNPSLITRQEYAVIRDKEVLSSDWLTDSILLELVQSPETYRLTWSSEKHMFQSMTPKFWTSSCVIGSEKTTPPKSSETLSSSRPQFARSSITMPEKDLPKPAPPVQPPVANPTREPAGEMVTLHKRQILPPTSISASHLLLKSALHVNTLRKMDKIQRDGKKNAKNRDHKLHRDTHEHHRKTSSADDIRDPTEARAQTTRATHERQKAEAKLIKSKPSSSSHITTSRSGNGPIFNEVQHMDVKDLKQKVEQRKVGLSMESESDSDSIVGSPLTISAKMHSAKKRKPSPTHEKPLLDVHGVKRWKAAESVATPEIHELPKPPTTEDQHQESEEAVNPSMFVDAEPQESKPSQDSNAPHLASMHSDPLDSLYASYRSPIPSSIMTSDHDAGDTGNEHRENGTPVEGMVDFLTQTMRGEHIKALPPPNIESSRPLEQEKQSSINGAAHRHHEANIERTAATSSRMELDREEEEAQHGRGGVERSTEVRLVTIQALTPPSGPKKGGDNVIVTLDRVEPQMKVVFGTVEAETISHPTMARLWATAPPSAIALPVLISIIDGFGHKVNTDLRRFEYSYL